MRNEAFIRNPIFGGKRGGEVCYMLQNVMESQRRPRAHKSDPVLIRREPRSGWLIEALFTDEEFERLKKWNGEKVDKNISKLRAERQQKYWRMRWERYIHRRANHYERAANERMTYDDWLKKTNPKGGILPSK